MFKSLLRTNPGLASPIFCIFRNILKTIRYTFICLISACLCTAGLCGCAGNEPFQDLIDRVVMQNDSVAGIIMHVDCPRLGISWTGVSGVADVRKNTLLGKEQPFRIASITKTFVSAALLRLNEEGRISLDDTIGTYLSSGNLNRLMADGYATDGITVRHLMNHTGGIFDYATSGLFFAKIYEDPEHWWTREEQLELAMQEGEPVGTPGAVFSYSDTGYILLGEMIENVTGKSLAASLRELIGYESLELCFTWMETQEEPAQRMGEQAETAGLVHPYHNGTDFFAYSPSIDLYGGGGLVSTVSDLAVFFRALFENRVFRNEETLSLMQTTPSFPGGYKPAQNYGLGLQIAEIDGITFYYHTGFWGTIAGYAPELDASIAINFTQRYDPAVLVECIAILKQQNFYPAKIH